jgi:hypothetical protein
MFAIFLRVSNARYAEVNAAGFHSDPSSTQQINPPFPSPDALD